MGWIHIRTGGSFPSKDEQFMAIDHGHADAVAQAIEWLSSIILPKATAQDHQLHEQGHVPRGGFDRSG